MANLKRNQAIVLLVGEILLIASSAAWTDGSHRADWLSAFYAAFLCMGGYLLANSKRWLVSYIAFAVIGVTSGFFQYNATHWLLLNTVCVTCAQAMLFYAVLRHSFFKPDVTQSDRVLAGVAGYLLLGLFWTMQFDTLAQLAPGSLHDLVTQQVGSRSDSLYFSFVTLMALGYGDLVPATPVAKIMAVFTSLTGVLYLAVFVSALVGGLKR